MKRTGDNMNYKEVKEFLQQNIPCRIDYQEFVPRATEGLYKVLEIENMIVERVIEEHEFLSLSEIERYYGEGLAEHEIQRLYYHGFLRLVLQDEEEVGVYHMLHLSPIMVGEGLAHVTCKKLESVFQGANKSWQDMNL